MFRKSQRLEEVREKHKISFSKHAPKFEDVIITYKNVQQINEQRTNILPSSTSTAHAGHLEENQNDNHTIISVSGYVIHTNNKKVKKSEIQMIF